MSFFKRILAAAFLLISLSFSMECLGATRTLEVLVNGSGAVQRNPALAAYPNGATVTLTALASNGWMFGSWSGDVTGVVNPVNLVMDGDKSVVANFVPVPEYPLVVSITGSGVVTPQGGNYLSNTVVSLQATPSEGWVFGGWTWATGAASENPVEIRIVQALNVTARFVQLPKILIPPTSLVVAQGETARFEVEAAGSSPLNFQWSFAGADLAGATDRVLQLSAVGPSDEGAYAVRVWNPYGSVTSAPVSLTVSGACPGSNVVQVCTEAALRQAITQGGLVRFCCNGTIVLSNTIDVATDVVLDASARNVVISGASRVRLFTVQPGVSFTATNLTLANGWHQGADGTAIPFGLATPPEHGQGGAILNDRGHVNLHLCILSNNVAVGGNAARLLTPTGPVEPYGGDGRGGAISSLGGRLTLDSVVGISNRVGGGFGKYQANGTNGFGLGGFLAAADSEVVLKNSRMDRNVALGKYASDTIAAGRAQGGAVYTKSSVMTIEDCIFIGNLARGDSAIPDITTKPASADGGALYTKSGRVKIVRSHLTSNKSLGGDAYRHSGTGKAQGGGCFNEGELVMIDSTLAENQSLAGSGSSFQETGNGGGIFNSGTIVLERTSLIRNKARGGNGASFGFGNWAGANGYGGGVFNAGTLLGTNCTIALNSVEAGNGSVFANAGVAIGGAIYNQAGSVSLMNSTIASNSAVQGLSGGQPSFGANLATETAAATWLGNSLVAGGQGAADSWGTILDGGHNIGADGSCAFASGTSFNFTDPLLERLDFYGGWTETMALNPESPAIDFGSAVGAPSVDQRGKPRPFGSGVDIGAFEVGPRVPRLALKQTADDSESVTLYFQGEAGVTYELWQSTDLLHWTLVDTIQHPSPGLVEKTVPHSAIAGYYRLSIK